MPRWSRNWIRCGSAIRVTELLNRQYFMTEVEAAVATAADGKGTQSLLLVEPDGYENRLGAVGLAQADDLLKLIATAC